MLPPFSQASNPEVHFVLVGSGTSPRAAANSAPPDLPNVEFRDEEVRTARSFTRFFGHRSAP